MVRTRIVCVSDTHGYSTNDAAFKLPKGDVLIHAGDLTKQGSMSELRRTVEWIEEADFEAKIVVAGNHDITLDPKFYSEHGQSFHNQNPESVDDCINLLSTASLVYLNHESTTIRLSSPDGPKTTFKVFGSPGSPTVGMTRKKWAFGYTHDEAGGLWDQIPLDTDIVVTHTPPASHCDRSATRGAIGCEPLHRALWRVRPRLAVCGHVHEARGSERVKWGSMTEPGGTSSVRLDLPPRESKKQSLVDLTGRKQPVLENDGWRDDVESSTALRGSVPSKGSFATDETTQQDDFDISFGEGLEERRIGRIETCIVNASIMANSYPYPGGKKFNAPIIVDLDLPLDRVE